MAQLVLRTPSTYQVEKLKHLNANFQIDRYAVIILPFTYLRNHRQIGNHRSLDNSMQFHYLFVTLFR